MARRNQHALILAGGRGTRFWPRSRQHKPKQLLPFLEQDSLLQATVQRLKPLFPPERIWVLTSELLRKPVLQQLPQLSPERVIAEPAQRNTAPCLALAARLLHDEDPDAVMSVFPADHYIAQPGVFLEHLRPALDAAEQGRLAVIGVRPRWAETGYGYVEFPKEVTPGAERFWPVRRFREKPNRRVARRYLASGNFFWNAGMFFWRTDVFLDAVRRLQPKMMTLLAGLPPLGNRRFRRALEQTYAHCDNISVDYAILEEADNVVGVAARDFGWSDLGSWNAVYELLPQGDQGNVTRSDALMIASQGNFVEAPGKLVALLGVENLIVVDTPDALLVADRARAQQVGELVRILESQSREKLI